MSDTPKFFHKVDRLGSKRSRTYFGTVLTTVLVIAPVVASALPVIPNGVGFGIDTPAGRGGTVYRVTNLNESGAGSLKECVAASGPRVCVFEVSGTIRLTQDLHVRNPNLTIAGQTAPSPGINLRGAALNINASDVLVQHIRIRVGDDPEGPAFGNRDALKVESVTPIKNVVIDHCSFAWALDETVSAWENWDNLTLTNNIIAEPLYERSDGKKSGFGMFFGQTGSFAGRAAAVGNLMAHTQARNPLTRSYDTVIANNVVYNSYSGSVEISSAARASSVAVVANVFIEGADTASWNRPVGFHQGGEYPISSTSKVYLSGNASPELVASDEWSITSGGFPTAIKRTSPPIWLTGFSPMPTKNDALLNHVLKYSGARPADRDSVDARVVKSVRDRTGRMINCVSANGTERCKKNAGGWPVLAQNRTPVVLPSDYDAVTSSGYTKLELWLHEQAAKVEGRAASKAPMPPLLRAE
jgi:hypothetical protein